MPPAKSGGSMISLRVSSHQSDSRTAVRQVRHWFVAGAILALSLGATPRARAQTSATVNVSVDGASPGTPLQPVWPFFGFDEINYTTSAEGKELLSALASAN